MPDRAESGTVPAVTMHVHSPRRSIDDLLETARSRLRRVDPAAALAAHRDGALLVDIRPVAQREVSGVIPGALVIERNVLEWRLDPASDARLPEADSYE